jgi:hypothetical protein
MVSDGCLALAIVDAIWRPDDTIRYPLTALKQAMDGLSPFAGEE